MTFFRSYFDESGKFKDHRVVSFCGVVASPESRSAFNDAWDALLRKNQLTVLHTTKALKASRALSAVIRAESPAQRCESLKPFVDCILNNLDLGVSITIDVTGFSKWTPGAKKMVGGNDNPAYVAFMQAVGAVRKYAFRDDDRISVMCDHDEDTALNFYALYRRFKAIDPEFRKKLVSISFSNDEQFPGLQAADLIAGLMRLEALRSFGYHTHDFRALTSSLMEPRENQKLKWIGMIGNSEKVEEMGEFLERRARAV